MVRAGVKYSSEHREKPVVRDSCRVGIKKSSNIRPIKFTLSSSDGVGQVLSKAKLLRSKEGLKSLTVYLCLDRTIDERRAYKKLVQELKLKREAGPDKSFLIKNNKIAMVSENSRLAHLTLEMLFIDHMS